MTVTEDIPTFAEANEGTVDEPESGDVVLSQGQGQFVAALLQNPQVCSIFTTPELKQQAAQIQAKAQGH